MLASHSSRWGGAVRAWSRRLADFRRRRATVALLRRWTPDDLEDVGLMRRRNGFTVW